MHSLRREHANPGDLMHIDVNRLGRIPDSGGRRRPGRAVRRKNRKQIVPVG